MGCDNCIIFVVVLFQRLRKTEKVVTIKLIREHIATLESAPTRPRSSHTLSRPSTGKPEAIPIDISGGAGSGSSSAGRPSSSRPMSSRAIPSTVDLIQDEVVAGAISRVESQVEEQEGSKMAQAWHVSETEQAGDVADSSHDANDVDDHNIMSNAEKGKQWSVSRGSDSPARDSRPFSSGFDGTIDIRSSLLNEVCA